jgi:hypothetical protein
VYVLLAATLPTGDWSEAGAIMTFAIPVGLFVIMSTILYFQYTRPHTVPGHRDLTPALAGGGGAGRYAAGAPEPAAPPPAATEPPGNGGPGRPEGTEGGE